MYNVAILFPICTIFIVLIFLIVQTFLCHECNNNRSVLCLHHKDDVSLTLEIRGTEVYGKVKYQTRHVLSLGLYL